MQKRIAYIDLAKGIAIILVVCGHIYGMSNIHSEKIINILGTMHNPLFYMASGILFGITRKKKDDIKVIMNKVMGLLIPFLIWCILYNIYVEILTALYHSEYKFSYWNAMNKLWFLPVLFMGFVAVIFMNRYIKERWIIVLLFVCTTIGAAFVSSKIAKIMSSAFLVYIGSEFESLTEKQKKVLGRVCAIFWIAIVSLGYLTGWIVASDGYVPGIKLLILLLSNVAGGILLIYLVSLVQNRDKGVVGSVISKLGANSLYVYILHYILIYWLEILECNNTIILFGCVFMSLLLPVVFASVISNTIVDRMLFKPSKLFMKERR